MIEILHEKLRHAAAFLPFMLSVGEHPKLHLTRIIEAIVIAAMTAGITMYGTQKVLEERIGHVANQVRQNQQDIRAVDSALQEHLRWELDQLARYGRKAK